MALSQGGLRLLSQTNLISFPNRFLQAVLFSPAASGCATVASLPLADATQLLLGAGVETADVARAKGQARLLPQPGPAHSPEAECGLGALDKPLR